MIKQREQKDCGITCLQMILAYYHSYVPKEQLRVDTNTTSKGTSAYGLMKGAQKVGFHTRALKGSFDALKYEFFIYPCIAHIIYENGYQHYVVIYRIDTKKKRLLIADPETGLKWTSFLSFQSVWSNFIIELKPLSLPKETKKVSTVSILWQQILCYKKDVLLFFLFAILETMLSILLSFQLKFGVDLLSNFGTKGDLWILALLFFILMLFLWVSNFFYRRFFLRWNHHLALRLTEEIVDNIISLPYHMYFRRTSGEIMTYFQNLQKMRSFLVMLIGTISLDLFLCLGALLFIALFSWQFFLISITLLFLYGGLFYSYHKIYQNQLPLLQRKQAKLSMYFLECIRGYATIKGSHLEASLMQEFKRKLQLFSADEIRLEQHQTRQRHQLEHLVSLVRFLVIWFGMWMVLEETMHLGILLVCYSLYDYIIAPFDSILTFFLEWIEIKQASEELSFLFEKRKEENRFLLEHIDTIEWKHFSFGYDEELILKDVNLKIESGVHTMFFGPSGSGKSTLFQVLMKFFSSKEKGIYINGIVYQFYEDNSYNQHLSYLSQQEILFTDTIYANLTMYRNVSQSELFKACKICRVDKMISHLKSGYHTLLEENGKNLSGGERQRLLLARTLLLPSEMVIIDEGLNQVEVALEREILTDIMKYYPEKTILYVTHRFHNFDVFPKLVQMRDGKVKATYQRKEQNVSHQYTGKQNRDCTCMSFS